VIEGLEPLVNHYEQEGARRFSRWDGALFRTLVEGPGQTLCGRLAEQPGSEAVFEAFVRLLVEAIGCGYVGPDSLAPPGAGRRAPRNLIELFFLDLIPARLGGGSAESQVAVLARAWNLGEGLLGEPAWMNRAVAGAMASLDSLADLDRKLVRVLEAALVVRAPSTLAGPFTTRTVDTKEFDNAFLPGRMHFSAPALLCVHDRKRSDIQAGILLAPRGAATLLPPGPCLGAPENKDEGGLPTITLVQGGLRIGDARLPLPMFKRGHASAASRAGLIAVSALDSQRLWIVESP
jgi:hypothetical protein